MVLVFLDNVKVEFAQTVLFVLLRSTDSARNAENHGVYGTYLYLCFKYLKYKTVQRVIRFTPLESILESIIVSQFSCLSLQGNKTASETCTYVAALRFHITQTDKYK